MADATYFQFSAGGSFLELAALQRGRCAITYRCYRLPFSSRCNSSLAGPKFRRNSNARMAAACAS